MEIQNTPQYKNAYNILSKQKPFDTTLITDSLAAAKTITASFNAPILANSVTTLKSFAKHIVQKARPDIKTISTEEQFIAFSKIASNAELSVSKNKSRASPALVKQLIYIYTTEKAYLTKIPPASKKHEAVIKIIREYEERLEKNNLCDSFSVIEKAVSLLENKEFKPGNIILYKIRPQNKLLSKFLDAITNAADEVITYGAEIPEELPSTLSKENITAYKDSNAEIKAVLEKISRLIESGVSPKEILLLSPAISKTVSLLNEFAPDFFANTGYGAKTLKYHCYDKGTSLASVPAVRSALAYLSAVTRNFKLEDLEEIADSPFFPQNPAKISAGTLRRIGVMTQVSDKKENWQNTGQKLSKKKRDAMSNEFENLNLLINTLDSIKPGKTVKEHCAAFKSMLKKLGWTEVSLNGDAQRARDAFLTLIDLLETSSVCDEEVDSTAFYSYILRFALTKFAAKEETKDSFCVSKLGSASSLCADYVFIVGLSADSIPSIPSTVPPFCESETEEILPTLKQDVFEAERYRFLTALSSAKKELHLSCAKKETGSGGKNLTPSSFLTKLFDCEPAPGYIELKHSILENQTKAGAMICKKEPVCEFDEFDEFDEFESEAEAEATLCKNKSCKGLVGLTSAESVIKQIKRDAKRGNANFSASDEPEDAEIALKSFEKYNDEYRFAPTTLEDYVKCPFAWYLKHHLNLTDVREENSQATTVGNTVHKILQRFLEEYFKPVTEESKAEAKAELMKIAREEFDKIKLKTPSFIAVRDYYLGEDGLKSAFDGFLENEITLNAAGLSTPMGYTEREIESFIELGNERILLKGKIDRILLSDDGFEVADYKTGSGFSLASNDNSRLQIPLYSMMFENITGRACDGGFYMKIAPKEFKTLNALGPDRDENISLALHASFDAVHSMRKGVCRIMITECDEKYCAFRYICGRSKTGGV